MYFGADVDSHVANVATPDQCREVCRGHPLCHHWTHSAALKCECAAAVGLCVHLSSSKRAALPTALRAIFSAWVLQAVLMGAQPPNDRATTCS